MIIPDPVKLREDAEALLDQAADALLDPNLSPHLRRHWQATLLDARHTLRCLPPYLPPPSSDLDDLSQTGS